MRKFLLLITLLVVGFVTLPSGGSIHAQQGNEEGENITMAPATVKPDLVAGEVYSGRVRVMNNGKTDYTFKMYAKPFSVKQESYQAEFETVNKYTEVYQWVRFETAEFRLKSGENVSVPYTVVVPSDARPGGHYAVLFAETQPEQKESVARKKRVGSLMYATVAGEYASQGSVESFNSDTWFRQGPVTSAIRLRNDGNVHFEATTDVIYKTLFGKAAYSDRQTRMVMPGTTRRIDITWQKPPLFGIYKLSGTAQYLDKTEVLPGKYIVVMPYWLIGAIGGLVLVGVGRLIMNKKKRGDHEKASTEE